MNVLCIADYFLPGFKGGGPIRTLENMRAQLVDDVTISVLTRDRDLGSNAPYPHIRAGEWFEGEAGPILYLSPTEFGPAGVRRVLAEKSVDLVYLNSFFSVKGSILPLLTLRRYAPEKPVLLAPRGEFSPGALQVRPLKKAIFLSVARLLGVYDAIQWHASTEIEADDILAQFPAAGDRIHIAPDPVSLAFATFVLPPPGEESSILRMVFISRISPMKNLDGLLQLLSKVNCTISLDIFGPIEDEEYWSRCQKLIQGLGENVHVQVGGALEPEKVSSTFADYDLFVLPTHGENFGHIIFESLRAGTPVLLSDRTPWKDDNSGAVTTLPLTDLEGWRSAIEKVASMSRDERSAIRAATIDYAQRYVENDGSLEANLSMFKAVI